MPANRSHRDHPPTQSRAWQITVSSTKSSTNSPAHDYSTNRGRADCLCHQQMVNHLVSLPTGRPRLAAPDWPPPDWPPRDPACGIPHPTPADRSKTARAATARTATARTTTVRATTAAGHVRADVRKERMGGAACSVRDHVSRERCCEQRGCRCPEGQAGVSLSDRPGCRSRFPRTSERHPDAKAGRCCRCSSLEWSRALRCGSAASGRGFPSPS